MSNEAEPIIASLQLGPHPEGGYYRETFRSDQTVATPAGLRNSSTAIYYLLKSGDYSGWHRVSADEAWHHYQGQTLRLHLLDRNGYRCVHLGQNIAQGERPQFIVPAGCWQAADVPSSGYALCGCTVAPGFDFDDFEMASLPDLLDEFADYEDQVRSLTRTESHRE